MWTSMMRAFEKFILVIAGRREGLPKMLLNMNMVCRARTTAPAKRDEFIDANYREWSPSRLNLVPPQACARLLPGRSQSASAYHLRLAQAACDSSNSFKGRIPKHVDSGVKPCSDDHAALDIIFGGVDAVDGDHFASFQIDD